MGEVTLTLTLISASLVAENLKLPFSFVTFLEFIPLLREAHKRKVYKEKKKEMPTKEYLFYNTTPRIINKPEIEKIKGHNLYGKKLTLKPVKSDRMAIEKRKHDELIR